MEENRSLVMAVEIERKFLVVNDSWRKNATSTHFQQGYLSTDPGRSVRVRIAGEQAWLTIKGKTEGVSRAEFEYPIPVGDANELLALCLPTIISKTRHRVLVGNHYWEVDEFHDDNDGLVVAEIELNTAEEDFERPDWLGEEVSRDDRYYNASLSCKPFCQWQDRADSE